MSPRPKPVPEDGRAADCRLLALVAALVLGGTLGCERNQPNATPTTAPAQQSVVVYAALDRQFSEPILTDFAAATGIRVEAVYDTESTKTVGLTNRIRAERHRPRCDVFWNNEILNTLRLADEGLLQPCTPEHAASYPAAMRDPNGLWYGLAARARVLIVNNDLVPVGDRPASIRDLADPRWRGRTGIAKPLFGTTASHVAALFARLGPADATALLLSFKANDVQVLGGNKACAEMVGAGRLAFALTDTDDAVIERDANQPVTIVFPDTEPGGLGTLLLPNTLALIHDCPHPEAGVRLINHLLAPEIEARLATGPSAQIPLNEKCTARSRVLPGPAGGDSAPAQLLRPMEVDFSAAARAFPEAARFIEAEFLGP